MPNKTAAMICMGDYYGEYTNDYPSLNFALNNVEQLQEKLASCGWKTPPPASNRIATRSHCIHFLQDTISRLEKEDDWLLVYYVGHAEEYVSATDESPVYLVTSLNGMRESPYPLDSYFSDKDYAEIVKAFRRKAPLGHLITILDCCYAEGMTNNSINGSDFHSVFAACSGNAKAAYTDNSFFFKSLKKSWNQENFDSIKNALEFSMRNDYLNYSYANRCSIQIANSFINSTF